MDDTLSQIDLSRALCALLEEHRGMDVVGLDLRGLNAWTDFFVIATVNSNTHQQGLERHIKDFCYEKGIDILRVSPRPREQRRGAERLIMDDEWRLIDLGAIVIHLMTEKARSFYELERLWGAADVVYKSSSSSRSSSSSSSKSSS
ncbi:MAG: ribosome silencing factor [Treponema sp.]|nr:ribosome silencing factor [Treponema sp.]